MRHRKDRKKFNRSSSHRRCMFANMLKALIEYGRVETTLPKAKMLKRCADQIVTTAKKDSVEARRSATAELMIRYNKLSSKQARQAKQGDKEAYNHDRRVISKLFDELSVKYANRQGGYTRILKNQARIGDGAEKCFVEWV